MNPLLRGEILRLIPLSDEDFNLTALFNEGKYLINQLKEKNGYLESELDREILIFLSVCEELNNIDLLDYCNAIKAYSRNQRIIKQARKTIKTIVSGR